MKIRLFILTITFGFVFSKAYSQGNDMNEQVKFHNLNTSILNLYKQFPIVAVGEGQHNSALTFEWLTTLINEAEFPIVVNNIVVEFGASEYQWVMDAFVNGEDVPDSLFKKCWRETTQILVWDNPIYEKFFREVRTINNKLPKQKRIRILLGDPSFGSKEIHDEHSFHIIENEVLKKGQTALLIYGDLHLIRKDVFTNYADPKVVKKEFLNVIQFLEIHYPGKAFSIWGSVNTTDSLTNKLLEAENIQAPALVHTNSSQLGNLDFRAFYPYSTEFRTDSIGNDIETSQHIQMPMKNIVDGIIFRGSWEQQNYLAPKPDNIYADTIYLNELIRREQILNIPPYRTRLYFYKISGSKHFSPFEIALKTGDVEKIDSLYLPLKKQIPQAKENEVLNYTGHFFLRNNEVIEAINVFKLGIREHPDAFYFYDGLGDAYLTINEKDNAVKFYEEALLRNPNNKLIKGKLDKAKTM